MGFNPLISENRQLKYNAYFSIPCVYLSEVGNFLLIAADT